MHNFSRLPNRIPFVLALLAALPGLSACHHADPDLGTLPAVDKLAVGLHSFDGCDDLLHYMQVEADTAMTTQIEASKFWGTTCVAMAEDGTAVAAPTAGTASPSGAAAPAFSKTNNQVAGVDEADLIKTFSRGDALYTLSVRNPSYTSSGCTSAALEVAQIFPVEQARILSHVPFDASIDGVLLVGTTAVVIGGDGNSLLPTTSSVAPGVDVGYAGSGGCGYDYSTGVRVSVVDVTDLSAPKVIRERIMQGSYLAARLVGNTVRVVTSATSMGPTLTYWPDWSAFTNTNLCNPSDTDRVRINQAFDALTQANRKIIYASSLSDWLPQQYDRTNVADALSQTPLAPMDCATVLRPGDPAGTSVTRITTVDVDSSAHVQAAWSDVGIVADGQTVYASPTAMYIATNPYDSAYWTQLQAYWTASSRSPATDWIAFPQERTSLHRFSTTDATSTTYTASGSVLGSLLSQYAMDESAGALRVASTRFRYTWWDQTKSTNAITVFDATGNELTQVGALDNLQPGEHISAVRFFADKAYINTVQNITFVDPLLTVDLSNPRAPTLHATLTVKSDATYLYPMDANHLIAVGSTGGDYWLTSAMLSIFDVTQLDAPVESKNAPLAASGWAYSAALYDPHAFTYFTTQRAGQPLALLAMPVTIFGNAQTCYAYNCYTSGLRVFAVDLSAPQGFVLLGDVYHDSFAGTDTWGDQTVLRSVVVGPTAAGASYIVSVSNLGLKITDVAAFGAPLPSGETPSVQAIAYPR